MLFIKRVLVFLICLIICTGCVACNLSEPKCVHDYSNATCFSPEKCIKCEKTRGKALGHDYLPATCIVAETCSRCGDTRNSALGHTTVSGICARCGESLAKWEKKYYVDEFNNLTSIPFVAPKDEIIGTFSNSATTNSMLKVYIRVNESDCEIILWEYGYMLVKASSTTDYYITILLSNGSKNYCYGTMYRGGRVIVFNDYNKIVNILKTNEKISFFIEEDSEYGFQSTYLFKVDTIGFSDLYNETFDY